MPVPYAAMPAGATYHIGDRTVMDDLIANVDQPAGEQQECGGSVGQLFSLSKSMVAAHALWSLAHRAAQGIPQRQVAGVTTDGRAWGAGSARTTSGLALSIGASLSFGKVSGRRMKKSSPNGVAIPSWRFAEPTTCSELRLELGRWLRSDKAWW